MTDHPAIDRFPSWSPDGSTIAFTSDRDGNFEIYSMSVDGSNPVRVTDDPEDDQEPAWLSDGSRIVFCSFRTGPGDIWIMDPDGTDAVNLTNDPFRVTTDADSDFDSNWAADGTRLAFDTDRNGNWDIYTINANGTDAIRLTANPAEDESPAWRP